ncbi:MAG: D-tyrosyl-tRNA(Tyr) deacylase [Myxococcaceae bacterium]|nr:D-tyrosyl-tRNA(Tyr) deacylase [Myxococcaceae bacterium]
MRAVVQRVTSAEVRVDDEIVGAIEHGLLVYLGVGIRDGESEVEWMAGKLEGLRIFEDESEKMSRSVLDVGGAILVVSQFTLYGDVRKGRRPSFDMAKTPDAANVLYERVCAVLRERGLRVEQGRFRATMRVRAEVDGPVTILVDSDRAF